jgi:hypothetical protein
LSNSCTYQHLPPRIPKPLTPSDSDVAYYKAKNRALYDAQARISKAARQGQHVAPGQHLGLREEGNVQPAGDENAEYTQEQASE